MPMNPRLLRPLAARLFAFLLKTISGDVLTDASGDPLRTIQDA